MEADLNRLYWGGGQCEVLASETCGKCQVVFEEDIEGDKDDWFLEKADRFYFFEAYDSATKSFVDSPSHARAPGRRGKVGGIVKKECVSEQVHVCREKVKARARERGRKEQMLLQLTLMAFLTLNFVLCVLWMCLLDVEVRIASYSGALCDKLKHRTECWISSVWTLRVFMGCGDRPACCTGLQTQLSSSHCLH